MTLLLSTWMGCATAPDRPEPVVYDRVACDACGMLVSDPRFAAQLSTKDGERATFDDPACLFHYVADHGPDLAHAWFHDADEDLWLDEREVAFVPASDAPMDGGLRAVTLGTAGALSFAEASTVVLGRTR